MLKNKPTFRVGTINDSYYNIKNQIDRLEDEGEIMVKHMTDSPDGKVTNEFLIMPSDPELEEFSIYDYKFGFDPSDEEHYQEEYPFSVGGTGKDSVRSAEVLLFDVERYLEEDKDKVVAKGDGIEITQAMMDKLHAGQTVKLPNGSTLTFVKETKDEIEEQFINKMKYRAGIVK